MVINNGEVVSVDLGSVDSSTLSVDKDGNILIGTTSTGISVGVPQPYNTYIPSTTFPANSWSTINTGTYIPPADFNKVVEVSDLYYCLKDKKTWTAYPVVNITYDSYGAIKYYTVLMNNSFSVINHDFQQDKYAVANREQLQMAIKRGVEINVDCPPALLTEDEESVKEIVE